MHNDFFRDQLIDTHSIYEFGKTDIHQFIAHLQEICDSHQRLNNSDQFTVYFPNEYNLKNIIHLCDELQNFFKTHHVKSGKTSYVSVPITSHLTLRQDRLKGSSQYIPVIPEQNANPIDRFFLKKETEINYLCRALTNYFSNNKAKWMKLFPQLQKQREMDIDETLVLKPTS